MSNRRILSIWFPRLGAERLIRRDPALEAQPLAVIRDAGQTQIVASLSPLASDAGLHVGQPVRDAHAMCGGLVTRLQNPHAEGAFLDVLHRWAGKFSPWVARDAPDALLLDLTGCAHLFGGEAALLEQVEVDCTDLGLTIRCGIADTLGAAWALARYSARDATAHRSGDAIDQEARATRSRAAKRRHWERGGAAPATLPRSEQTGNIAPVGKAHSALGPLPVAALRLDPEVTQQLARLGLRRISDLAGQPRAALARRFGKGLVLRLDQAFGATPEPVTPARAPDHFATRLTLPDPIGLEEDMVAALDKLIPPLCETLRRKARGARTLRLEAWRSDGGMQWLNVSLARATHDPDRIQPLLRMKLPEIEAGFGIDMLRLEALLHEPLHMRSHAGHLDAARNNSAIGDATAMEDLLARLGARIGMENITRRHPGASHLPEKSSITLAAAWSEPARDWPLPATPRPLLIWRPEMVNAPATRTPPTTFRWRGRHLTTHYATGPERIAPEWWLDDPDWRTGLRDYWQIVTTQGDHLWLYFAHGAALSEGWFCHGSFA